MTAIPDWPEAPGPRVLTLAGNDLTIDARARKTASSLSRAGCSVVAIGVDSTGTLNRSEELDGALLFRVTPSLDSRLSPRSFRLSRAEIRDSLNQRLNMRRARLNLRRRSFTAWRWWTTRQDPSWVQWVGETAASITRFVGVPEETRHRIRSRINRPLRKVDRFFRLGPKRARLKMEQRFTEALTLVHKAFARSSDRAPRAGNWRRDLPELHRYEAAIGSIVDVLEPDLIHVHDIFHLGLAARAKSRAGAGGRDMAIVYDAQEFIPGLPSNPRRRAAYTDLEEEYVGRVDAIVTVSESLADLIESRYAVRPAIVLNAHDPTRATSATPLRAVAGAPESASLVVYVGGLAPDRGAETLLNSIAEWPTDAILVFVTNSHGGYADHVRSELERQGLSSRVRFAPFVDPEAVVSYIESADVSVIPLSRDVINYEVALPNKLFQSIHAGVPVVVSDNPEMSRFVTEWGIGEVFESGDSHSLAAAINKVLSERDRYVAPMQEPSLLDELSWERQANNLMKTYASIGVQVGG